MEEEQARLAAFEAMLAAVLARQAELTARLAALRAGGREKSAAFRQLRGEKLTLQTMLAFYRAYGLLPPGI